MKKCGAPPNVDTYVQLAHSLNTLNLNQKNGTIPNVRHSLEIFERLQNNNLADWHLHGGIGIFLKTLHESAKGIKTVPEIYHKGDLLLLELLDSAKVVWKKASPIG